MGVQRKAVFDRLAPVSLRRLRRLLHDHLDVEMEDLTSPSIAGDSQKFEVVAAISARGRLPELEAALDELSIEPSGPDAGEGADAGLEAVASPEEPKTSRVVVDVDGRWLEWNRDADLPTRLQIQKWPWRTRTQDFVVSEEPPEIAVSRWLPTTLSLQGVEGTERHHAPLRGRLMARAVTVLSLVGGLAWAAADLSLAAWVVPVALSPVLLLVIWAVTNLRPGLGAPGPSDWPAFGALHSIPRAIGVALFVVVAIVTIEVLATEVRNQTELRVPIGLGWYDSALPPTSRRRLVVPPGVEPATEASRVEMVRAPDGDLEVRCAHAFWEAGALASPDCEGDARVRLLDDACEPLDATVEIDPARLADAEASRSSTQCLRVQPPRASWVPAADAAPLARVVVTRRWGESTWDETRAATEPPYLELRTLVREMDVETDSRFVRVADGTVSLALGAYTLGAPAQRGDELRLGERRSNLEWADLRRGGSRSQRTPSTAERDLVWLAPVGEQRTGIEIRLLYAPRAGWWVDVEPGDESVVFQVGDPRARRCQLSLDSPASGRLFFLALGAPGGRAVYSIGGQRAVLEPGADCASVLPAGLVVVAVPERDGGPDPSPSAVDPSALTIDGRRVERGTEPWQVRFAHGPPPRPHCYVWPGGSSARRPANRSCERDSGLSGPCDRMWRCD